MKKILGFAIAVALLSACSGTGDRTDNMPTVQNQAPASPGNSSVDSSPSHVRDSTSVPDYDTSAQKHKASGSQKRS